MSMSARIARIERAVRPQAKHLPWAPPLVFNDDDQAQAFASFRAAGLKPDDIAGPVCIRLVPLKPLENRHVE